VIVGLTFFEKYHAILTYLLILDPIAASLGNFLILPRLDEPTLYISETYFIIFWVFILSGLRLFHAIISVSVIIFISLLSSMCLSSQAFMLHLFWILCATSFGILGAYLLERSNKKVFKNKEILANLANTDKLTGLYNRAKFDEVLSHELARTERFHHSFGLVMIDIDYFKLVNDNYGHHVGDTFLVEISTLLKNSVRSTDILVRWGGEEFALICLESSLSGILTLVETIRTRVEEYSFMNVGKRTISIGVTMYEENDTDTMMISRADKALYDAKNSGRNCIKVAK
jgi:diguanylate cyclase (GGDEF)-like protein